MIVRCNVCIFFWENPQGIKNPMTMALWLIFVDGEGPMRVAVRRAPYFPACWRLMTATSYASASSSIWSSLLLLLLLLLLLVSAGARHGLQVPVRSHAAIESPCASCVVRALACFRCAFLWASLIAPNQVNLSAGGRVRISSRERYSRRCRSSGSRALFPRVNRSVIASRSCWPSSRSKPCSSRSCR